MEKIGLFWGSNTGNQEEATNFLTDYMKSEGYEIDLYNIAETPPGKGGEIQLTDALHMMARQNRVIGFKFEGRRIDTGNALGLLHASMYQAFNTPDMKEDFLNLLEEFLPKKS